MTPLPDAVGRRCFLCQEPSDDVVWSEGPFEGRRCRCGLVFTTGDVDALATDLDHEFHYDEFYELPAGRKARWVASHAPMGRLLEVGAGNPFFLREARGLGYEVEGLEPNRQRARATAAALGVSVHEGFVESYPMAPATFDVVYHCDLLVHFPDPVLALQKMVRLLRPGGVLALEVGVLGGISPHWY